MPNQARRITAIDGYRAFAISAVVLHHALSAPGFPAWLEPVARLLPRGVVGFWVLSGFLVTRSLLLEEQSAGSIQLWKFYQRQGIRYFIPMFAYLLIIGALMAWRIPGFDASIIVRPAILDPNTFCVAESVSHLYSWFCKSISGWAGRSFSEPCRGGTDFRPASGWSRWRLLGGPWGNHW